MTQDINVTAARTGAVNAQFTAVNLGNWKDGAAQNALMIENNLRIFYEGLKTFADNFESASVDLQSSLRTQRDAIMSTVGGNAANPDVLALTDSPTVTNSCSFASQSIVDLQNAVAQASQSLSGLDDSGAIAGHLNTLAGKLPDEDEKITTLSTCFSNYQSAVTSWESNYSGKFSQDFITPDMIKAAQGNMAATYQGLGASAAIGKVSEFLNTIMGAPMVNLPVLKNLTTLGWKGLKTILSYAGKAMADAGKAAVVFEWNGFLKTISKDGKIVDSNFLKKLKENFGLFRPQDWKKTFGQLITGESDYNRALSGATQTVSKWGTRIKVAGRVMGWVGDAVDLFNVGCQAQGAYVQAQGDSADKAAAATVTAVGGVAKWGAGKVAGAAIGACIGGPLGAVVGMAAGEAVSYGLDWFSKTDAGKAIGSWTTKQVSNVFHAVGNWFK